MLACNDDITNDEKTTSRSLMAFDGKNCRGNLLGWPIDGDDKMREASCART